MLRPLYLRCLAVNVETMLGSGSAAGCKSVCASALQHSLKSLWKDSLPTLLSGKVQVRME